MTDTINMLDHALALAAKGFKVFPLQPNGKLPIWEGWPDRATTDAATIRGWWSDPLTGGSKPYNVGVCTSGLLVTDPDAKGGKPGLVNWEINDAIFGTPDHPVTITPTGGQHHFFKLPAGINPETVGNIADSAKRESPLGKGIDARSWHGFVVGAGSVIDGVPYRWQAEAASVADLPDAPDWIIDKCKRQVVERPDTAETPEGLTLDTPAALHRATWYLQHEAPEAVEGDGGDSTAFSVACHVRDYGVSREMALELLLDHWNDRCCPPWSPEDLELKVGNAYKYAREQIGCASAETQFEPLPDQAEAIDVPIERAGSTAKKRKFLRLKDMREIPTQSWVVKRVLLATGLMGLCGASSSGKSFAALDWGLCIAYGIPWHGIKVTQRDVIYVAAEGAVGLTKRIMAWRKAHFLDGPEHDDAPFFVLPTAVNLLDSDPNIQGLISEIKEHCPDPGLIVIDIDLMPAGALTALP
ncbi:bifunctional DNA primase/polymerase [Paramagnetospirillum magneticum]|uniref:DNA primase/polymerase bifunctional N-terminal domain-containing protein n=1 Tax=Paramagnetospirillum magneticum (strain ATCC 700264 / AMB-1) TaxID=342108 RepID=Q2W5Z2_PARM1|nr:bifunctional DNA primase/polymerase [Paramagnetospirillum magneticum]BAE50733.1 hypothetical protein amb1929 [Paramagnetospirillum magneticum AMB-1]